MKSYFVRTLSFPSTRREFLAKSLAATSLLILPRGLRGESGVSPNEKVRTAFIGVGNRGLQVLKAFARTENLDVVALCDVDMGAAHTIEAQTLFPDAARYQDFRKLFDESADQFDAVVICTPDHAHFAMAMLAMGAGKHVFVEKPLAHTFQEIELLMAMEAKSGVVTQMGNQGHSGPNYFQFEAWEKAGVIKDVTRIDAYMNAPRRWHGWSIDGWPSGEPVPETIDWDLWNMARPERPFDSKLHPGNWRGWFLYGNGAFGDWGPHILDTCHRFLELELPAKIEAVKRVGPNEFIFPQASTILFSFSKRGQRPACDVYWYDGVENLPDLPPEENEGLERRKHGKYIYSKDLVFKGGTHSETLRIIPEEKMKAMARELPRFSQRNSDHFENFLLACQGKEKTRSPFSVSGPLSQVFSLGVIAQRLGGKLRFDQKRRRFKGNKVANELLVGPPPAAEFAEYYKV